MASPLGQDTPPLNIVGIDREPPALLPAPPPPVERPAPTPRPFFSDPLTPNQTLFGAWLPDPAEPLSNPLNSAERPTPASLAKRFEATAEPRLEAGAAGATAITNPGSPATGGQAAAPVATGSNFSTARPVSDLSDLSQAALESLAGWQSDDVTAGRPTPPVLSPGPLTHSESGSLSPTPLTTSQHWLRRNHGRQPLGFEPNRGQVPAAQVQFLTRGNGHTTFLTANEAVLTLRRPGTPDTRTVLRMRLAGANPNARGTALDPLAGRTNYFIGRNPQNWRSNVPHFGQVAFRNVYPGIDAVYYGTTQRRLEFDLVVHPGASPATIRLDYQNTLPLTLNPQGHLVLRPPGAGVLVQHAPVIYQLHNGVRQSVAGRYVLHPGNQVSFQVGAYDLTRALYIDPELDYSSYLGGAGDDEGHAIATDNDGNLYVTGGTTSDLFFPDSSTISDNSRAFVSKLDADGNLLYTTFFGGAALDQGNGIAVDAEGNVYVTGTTQSSNFILVGAPFQNQLHGEQDAFLAILAPDGKPAYTTYLGGSDSEEGTALALEPFLAINGDANEAGGSIGGVVLTGVTRSADFPTFNPLQQNFGGDTDAFVVKLVPSLNGSNQQLVYGTHLGGGGPEMGYGVTVDRGGQIYVAGSIASADIIIQNPIDGSFGGLEDGFVAKIDPTRILVSQLTYFSYVGGNAADAARAVALDPSNNAYVTGWTDSLDFPTTPGAFQTVRPNQDASRSAFVVKVNAAGSAFSYATYLNGTDDDTGYAIAVDADGLAYVTGQTASSDFPTVGPLTAASGPMADAFISRVNDTGSALLFSSRLGGSYDDSGQGIVLSADAECVYVTGWTASGDFPTVRAHQYQNAGGIDAFVAKIALRPAPPTITHFVTDSGLSNGDRITLNQNLTFHGQAEAGSLVNLTRVGLGVITNPPVTADALGNWSFNYGATTLPEGQHAFTAMATFGGLTSASSATFVVTVDRTAPAVTLFAPASTSDCLPEIRVLATDLVGLPNSPTVPDDYQVGLYVDGLLTSPRVPLQDGQALFRVPTGLSVEAHTLQARVRDIAGNEGVSALVPITITAAGAWVLSGQQRTWDPFDGLAMQQTGNVQLTQALDLDQNPGTAVSHDPRLVYNSDSVYVQPIIEATLQVGSSVPTSITFTLTWDIDDPVVYERQVVSRTFTNTPNLCAGSVLTVGLQVPSPVNKTERYRWRLNVTTSDPLLVIPAEEGVAFVVSRDGPVANNPYPFGAGWSFSLTDQLVTIPARGGQPEGLLRLYGTGSWRFYPRTDVDQYAAPAGDPGQLIGNATAGYVYSLPDGQRAVFNGLGLQTSWQSADTFEALIFDPDPANYHRLSTVTASDGAVSTFGYDANGWLRTINAVGARTTTVLVNNATRQVDSFTDPENGLRTFGYFSPTVSRLTSEAFANFRQSWNYAYGAAFEIRQGVSLDTQTTVVVSAAVAALGGLLLGTPRARLTDGLGHVTRWTLDPYGRSLTQLAADGGLWTWDRHPTLAQVLTQIDPLGRVTTYQRTYAANPYAITQETLPDGKTRRYSYVNVSAGGDPRVRQRLQTFTDERGSVTTYQYDTLGHRTQVLDAREQPTILTYVPAGIHAGLPQSITDPRGTVTSFGYDTSLRRLERTIEALGTPDQRTTTMLYDVRGNPDSTTHGVPSGPSTLLPHQITTSYLYDKLNRPRRVIDAWGVLFQQRTTFFDYDALGNLTSTRDPLLHETRHLYDSASRRWQTIDAYNTFDARTTLTEFDTAGNVSRMLDPLGHLSLYGYDALNRATRVTEAVGTLQQRTSQSRFDLAGNLRQRWDPLGRRTDTLYDDRNRPTHLTEAVGLPLQQRTTITDYDGASNVVAVHRPRGYDVEVGGNGQRISTRYAYDKLHRTTQVAEAATVSFSGTATGAGPNTLAAPGFIVGSWLNQTVLITDGPGAGQARRLVANDGLTLTVTPDWNLPPDRPAAGSAFTIVATERLTTTAYDPTSNVLAVTSGQSLTNPHVVTTSFLYDRLNQRKEILEAWNQPEQRRTTMLYDAAGNLRSQTSGLGTTTPHPVQTDYSYNQLNQRTAVTEAAYVFRSGTASGGTVNTLVHTLAGWTGGEHVGRKVLITAGTGANQERLILANTADTLTVASAWDMGVPDSTSQYLIGNAERRTTTLTYDLADNLRQLRDPMQHLTTVMYDALDRPTAQTRSAHLAVGNPARRTDRTTYNGVDQVTRRTDPLLHPTGFGFDALNRPRLTVDALGKATNQTYDAANNRTAVIDPVSNSTGYVYDGLNRLIRDTTFWGTRFLQYDAENNLTSRTDRTGKERRFVYDLLDRQTQENWYTGGALQRTLNFSYDAANNLLSASDPQSFYGQQYDKLNRAFSITYSAPTMALGVTWTQTFDAANNRRALAATVNSVLDVRTTAVPDLLDRMRVVEQTGQGGNGVAPKRVTMDYNALDQFQTVARYSDLAGTQLVASSVFGYEVGDRLETLAHSRGPTGLSNYTWHYDAADRLKDEQHSGMLASDGLTTYTYDIINQLRLADRPDLGNDENYAYDANGNRTGTLLMTAADNRLMSDATYDYNYDGEGNRTWRQHRTTGEVTVYSWDHRQRLTQVTITGGSTPGVTNFTYDVFDRRIAKAGPAGTQRFVYDGPHIALVLDGTNGIKNRYLHGPMVDQVLADEQVPSMSGAGVVYWPLTDHLGTVRDLADGSDNLVRHWGRDSFGKQTSTAGSSGITTLFGFTGREFDSETGLYYYRARYYDPQTGQFLGKDPIEFTSGDANLYRYVGNSPANFIDPYGLDWQWALNWHHLLPQAHFNDDFLKKHGLSKVIDINSTEYGYMLRGKDHIGKGGLHPSGWNPDWREWILEQERQGKQITKEMIDEQLEKMMKSKKYSEFFDPNISKKATVSYKQWETECAERAVKKAAKEAAEKEAAQMVKKTINNVEKQVAESATKRVGKRIAKAIPLLGWGIIIYCWTEDVEAKGPAGGTANSALDAVPYVGTGKAIVEIGSGYDIIPDKGKPGLVQKVAESGLAPWDAMDAYRKQNERLIKEGKPPVKLPPPICFVRGTSVHSRKGLLKIEDIVPGDEVLSWNEVVKQFEYRVVTKLISGSRESLVELQGEGWTVTCSSNHPFLMQNGAWKRADAITEGDTLMSKGASPERVLRTLPRHIPSGVDVFNFEVEETHTYCVTERGLVVHNVK